jgi:hypothetical protein
LPKRRSPLKTTREQSLTKYLELAAQFYFWTLYFDPNAAGHDPTQVLIVAGVFVLGFAFYYIMKLIKRSQGIDVTLAFKEIPIE